jgi:hypothetical protein
VEEPLSFYNALQFLIGEQLSSVEFVQDYVQLRFNGPCLTVYCSLHQITKDDLTKTWGEAGYCDELCRLTALSIEQVRIEPSECLAITFDDGSIWSMSLRDEHYRGPEALCYTDSLRGLWYAL